MTFVDLLLHDGMNECGRSQARSAFRCHQAVWLLALAMVGCAAPAGHRLSHRLNPQSPPAGQSQQLAAGDGFDQRRDEMQFQLAEARWRRNDLEACQQTLEEIVSQNPGHRGAHLRLAELYLLKNQPCQALALMRRFCRTNREDAEGHHLLGLAYEAIGQGDRALAAYDVAASLDPEDPIVRSSLENAVASREAPGLELASSARTTPAGPPSTSEVDREGDDAPPSRSPRIGASFAASGEPKHLDHGMADAAATASSKPGPRIEIVPVEIPAKDRVGLGETSGGAEAADNSGNLPTDDADAPGDAPPSQPGAPGKSPVRWAYELEVGHVKPTIQEKLEEEPVAAPKKVAAPNGAANMEEQEK